MTEKEINEEQMKLLKYLKEFYPSKEIDITHFFTKARAKYNVTDQYLDNNVYAQIDNRFIDFHTDAVKINFAADVFNVHATLRKEGYDYLINEDNLALTKQLSESTISANKNQLRYAIISGAAIILTTVFAWLSFDVSNQSLKISKESLNIQKSERHEHQHDSICQILNNGQYIIIDTSDIIQHKPNTHK